MDNPRISFIPKKKRFWMILGLTLVGITILLAKFVLFSSFEKSRPKDGLGESLPKEKAPASPPDRVLSGEISKGQSLSSALRAQGLSPALVETLCQNLKPLINLRRIKPGDSFEVRLNPEGQFLNFTFTTGPLDIYQLTLRPSGEWLAVKKEVPVEKYWVRVSGEILSSLFETMDQLGEQDLLTLDFADIFAWEIDFHSDPQPGDRFDMVVEKFHVKDTFVKYGRILYADYQGKSSRHQAFFFEPSGGRGDYYTPQGDSLRKALLRSPLKFTRVSSGYSRSRRHPILGGNRPHYAVDYAAPQGSPVWAVADGTVLFCGWNGGYGNQIVISHPKGYQSMYGHLSSFTPGMRKGKKVRQKEVIGYVGSTGLATGPHLDFRLLKNGVYRNPLKEISPRAASLSKEQIPEFQRTVDPLVRWVGDPSASSRMKVASLTSCDLERTALKGRSENR